MVRPKAYYGNVTLASRAWSSARTSKCGVLGEFRCRSSSTKSIVTYSLLYGCEAWTLLADSAKTDPGFRNQVHEESSLYLLLGAQDQRLGAEQDQLPRGSTGTFSGNCQKTETFMVRACHTPRQPLQNHPSGHLGGWASPWSAEKVLDGQRQRVGTPAHVRIAHKGFLQKRPEEDLC